MKDRLLKLCRRLDRFTFDDILLISEMDSEELEHYLNSFLSTNKLVLNNGIYRYNKDSKSETVSSSILTYYPSQIVDAVLRSYCAEVPSYKIAFVTGISAEQIIKFYKYFRIKIYERQYNLLENFYIQKPQFAKHPTFLGQEATLYMYNNDVFVAKTPFTSEEQHLAGNNRKEYKKIYYYLTRELTHNSALTNMHHKIAESLWKRNKTFEERYSDLKSIIF